MLIDKKTVSVILLILGVLFSAPSYANNAETNNAENSSDDEDSFSIINVFRNTTTYDFTVGKGDVLLYPASAVGELMISGLLDIKANSIIRQAYLNNVQKSVIASGQIINGRELFIGGNKYFLNGSKHFLLAEPVPAMVGQKQKMVQVIHDLKISRAELNEHMEKAKTSRTAKGLRFFASALGFHALIIFGDSAYLAFFNN